MVDLATEYGQTNSQLQSNVNEALLQLGNIRLQIDALGIGDVNLPDAPGIDSPTPQFPNRPNDPNIQNVSFDPVSVGGLSSTVPGKPSIDRPSRWAAPSTQLTNGGFEQFFTGDDDTPEEIIARANEQVNTWVDSYFPALKDCFQNVPDDWICDVISGVRPLGNSETAIEVAWRVAKANQNRDTQSAKKTLYAEFASRGFSLPPGVMVAAIERLHERGMDLSSAANRDAALKDVDVQVQLLQTAVQTAASLKQGLMGIMADYYRVTAALSNDAAQFGIEKARIKSQADAQFNEAMLRFSSINQDYYKSLSQNLLQHNGQTIDLFSGEINAAQIRAQVEEAGQRLQLSAAEVNANNKRTEVQANTDIERTRADVYRTAVQAEGTRVGALNDVSRINLEQYRTEVEGKLAEAQAKSTPAQGTALSGAASAFGQIAASAANASGTLIARIEGV